MKKLFFFLLISMILSCSDSRQDTPAPGGTDKDPDPTTVTPPGKGEPGVVGTAGIQAWDQLSAAEKAKIKGWNTIFMHQSVGTDLEDGAAANGFRFEYFDLNEKPDKGLSGNVFSASNGMPLEKIAEFKTNALAHKGILKIAIFKFGYADIRDEDWETVRTAYKQMVDDLRTQIPGLRFVHITPPLVYIATKDEGNEAKMKMGQWMKATFAEKDVVFDLQAVESNDGACKLGNVWRICDEYRSTASCPSKSQGVDAPEGQGHLCEAAATKVSKAFLMSIYNTGR
ncbi:hypothetical protein GCM10010967_27950 [Dyadobacter beijingensis]|uniref:Uncharacterized protein n=1 Tax=Dyadobacter beijingensis TaxID=365489 RepID=A0ABQ2HW24_9BACT|nr:hypothetical protein [Dyadobacter beijingensis]GGM93248.1 hypothetical protein GCM10010967_27950 [Dyadobacter beijingensis]